jgi:hypothetical protein
MDFSTIINEVLKAIWWLIPIVIVIGIFKSPWSKGYLGELLVRLLARFMLDKDTYNRVHNVTLPTSDGTTQIDHIFVSRFGIFVLETKNMQGWISGGENQAQWTQKIYKQSFAFQNPLRQNFKHAKALEAALQVPPDTIHSVVTFVGGSAFKTDMPANVTYGAGFISYIRSFREQTFTENQVSDLLRRLESGRLAPKLSTHRKHVSESKESIKSKCISVLSEVRQPIGSTHSESGRKGWSAVLGLFYLPEM